MWPHPLLIKLKISIWKEELWIIRVVHFNEKKSRVTTTLKFPFILKTRIMRDTAKSLCL